VRRWACTWCGEAALRDGGADAADGPHRRKKKVLTAVTFQRRFCPVIQKGRRCANEGPVHTAVATFYKNGVGAGPYYKAPWTS